MKSTSLNAMLREENILLNKKIAYLKKKLDIYKYDVLTGFMLRRDYELTYLTNEISEHDIYLTIIVVSRIDFINVEKGYSCGDKILVETALSIKDLLPNGEYFRVSGGTFAVFTRYKPNNLNIDETVSVSIKLKDFDNKDELMLALNKEIAVKKSEWYKKHEIERRR
jgi:GGDEF domain-containing protein